MIARALVIAAGCAACSRGAARVPVARAAIEIDAEAGGLSAADADAAIARPITRALATGVDGIAHLSSESDARGVRVIAWLAGDDDRAYARIEEAIQGTASVLPPDVGPPQIARRAGGATIRVIVRDAAWSPAQLRTWTDWDLRPALMTIPGVADVRGCGGAIADLDVVLDPARLAAFGLGVDQVIDALGRADAAPADTRDGFVVRGVARSGGDLAAIAIDRHAGTPVRLADVAQLRDGGVPDPCTPAAPDGAVIADVALRADADAQAIADAIRGKTRGAPSGVTIQLVHAPARYHVALAADPGVDLRALAAAWRGALAAAPGVTVAPAPGVADTITIDRAACARADVDVDAVTHAAAVAAGGAIATTLWEATSRRDVRVTMPGADLATITVHGEQGPVPLASLVRRDHAPARVDTFDGAPAIIVDFAVEPGDGADAAAAAVDAAPKAAPPPANVRVTAWREP